MLPAKVSLLQFQIAGDEKIIGCCASLHTISQVIPLPYLAAVPGGPAYLVGLVNLAGSCVPVVDLALCLGLGRSEPYTLDTPLLICVNEAAIIGVVVDQVAGIVEIDQPQTQEKPAFVQATPLLHGAITLQGELSLLIDIATLVNREHGHAYGVATHD